MGESSGGTPPRGSGSTEALPGIRSTRANRRWSQRKGSLVSSLPGSGMVRGRWSWTGQRNRGLSVHDTMTTSTYCIRRNTNEHKLCMWRPLSQDYYIDLDNCKSIARIFYGNIDDTDIYFNELSKHRYSHWGYSIQTSRTYNCDNKTWYVAWQKTEFTPWLKWRMQTHIIIYIIKQLTPQTFRQTPTVKRNTFIRCHSVDASSPNSLSISSLHHTASLIPILIFSWIIRHFAVSLDF